VRFTDLSNFYYEWNLADLPWDAVTPVVIGNEPTEILDEKLVEAITSRAFTPSIEAQPKAKAAAITFLYLYMILAHGDERFGIHSSYGNHQLTDSLRPSFNFTARSTLPIGAGLGSSASFSACAATTILLLHQRISVHALPLPTHLSHERDAGQIHASHQERRAIAPKVAEEVNRWAFVAEKILHGNPSGVDNSVAVFGGALAYTRLGFGKKSGMDPIQGFVHTDLKPINRYSLLLLWM
jgi:hypothetical protein